MNKVQFLGQNQSACQNKLIKIEGFVCREKEFQALKDIEINELGNAFFFFIEREISTETD